MMLAFGLLTLSILIMWVRLCEQLESSANRPFFVGQETVF
jgi:MFS superfamily sulfate permease-like transporter